KYDGRVKKEITSLQKFGYQVVLVCTSMDQEDSIQNYPYKIYKLNHPSGKGILDKTKNKLRFKSSISQIITSEKPDYIHCNDSTILYVGRWIKKVKVIYDAHELLPELEVGFRKTITRFMERRKLRHVYKVILPQIDRLNIFYFQNRDILIKKQLFLLENFPSKSNQIIDNYFLHKYNYQTNNKILSYVGVISNARNIYEIVEAVSKIEKMTFFIIGKGQSDYTDKIQELISERNIGHRVFLKEPIPNDEVISVSESSDLGICFYSDPNLNSYLCASNKLYENLNCGMAVLTNNIAGTARIIQPGFNGYVIDDITPDQICKGLKQISDLSPPIPSTYYWENQEGVLKEIYQ